MSGAHGRQNRRAVLRLFMSSRAHLPRRFNRLFSSRYSVRSEGTPWGGLASKSARPDSLRSAPECTPMRLGNSGIGSQIPTLLPPRVCRGDRTEIFSHAGAMQRSKPLHRSRWASRGNAGLSCLLREGFGFYVNSTSAAREDHFFRDRFPTKDNTHRRGGEAMNW